MAMVYVTGHRNPDMDSICSAYAYSVLKNTIDKENTYIPVRLGSANKNIKALFQKLNIELPQILKDVKIKVKDVTKKPKFAASLSDPTYKVIDIFSTYKPTVIPIFDENRDGAYVDLLTADDINAFFLRENNGKRLTYLLSEKNINEVVPGEFIKRGKNENFEAPFMVGAMEYEQFKKRLKNLESKPVLVTGLREKHIKRALKENIPGLIITGLDNKEALSSFDLSNFDGFIYLSKLDTAETLRLLRLSSPVSNLIDNEHKTKEIQSDTLFDDAKEILVRSEDRGLSVFEKEEWKGYVTRRCFLNKPKVKLILTDHNEVEQSVIGIEEAEIIEIIDHHRLSPPRMKNPIYICSEPLGSTCTIVYEQYKKYGVEIKREIAEILLSGIMSDTVMLKSPTTTEYDKQVALKLKKIANIDNLQDFCSSLFQTGLTLKNQDPIKIIESDLKKYYESGVRFAIGQVEVTSLDEIKEIKDVFLLSLEKERNAFSLDFCMLLVTDVINDVSLLLTTPFNKETRLFWEKLDNSVYSLPGVLSRKKQLLPEILRLFED